MPNTRQRQWKSQIQQQALLEFGLLKHACPEGIYLSLTPGNFALWSGVLFVRTGPYAPAVLRFQIAFPQRYPEVPPLILFTSDVFHPLITPLTTYTYSTGSSAADPVSATDEERLLPGGFSLRHGFPRWFGKATEADGFPSTMENIDESEEQKATVPQDTEETRAKSPVGLQTVHIPPPKDDGGSLGEVYPSIIELLRYMKRVFEEDTILDELPIEAAGNPGAWHAWQAHRRKSKSSRSVSEATVSQNNTPLKGSGSSAKSKASGDWNWKGVWVDRVKRGVNSSLSEAMLYKDVDNDDLIHFLDVDEEAAESLKGKFSTVPIADGVNPSQTLSTD